MMNNRVDISNFLNNECVNINVTWYRVFNFLLGGRDADIIDLNYKREWDVLFNNQILSGDYSKNTVLGAIRGSLLQKLCLLLANGNGSYTEGINAN